MLSSLVIDLFTSFSPVTLTAQHLAVLDDRAASVAPGGDVVALHELEVELLAADGADVVLLLPHSELDVLGEGAEVEVMLVACQHVGDDARLTLHLAIAHQCGDTQAHGGGV